MKVCVVGAGAIGTFIGTHLARTGCEVAVLARGATAAALRAHGFRLRQDGAVLQAPVRVAERADALGPQALVVVAVKSPALPGVAEAVGALLGPETMVLPAMNGVPWWFFHGLGGPHEGAPVRAVDPEGRVAASIPVRHVIGCVVHATCSVEEPGLVRHGFGRGLIIGEPSGGVSDRVTALGGRLSTAGFETTVTKRVQADVWYKLWGSARGARRLGPGIAAPAPGRARLRARARIPSLDSCWRPAGAKFLIWSSLMASKFPHPLRVEPGRPPTFSTKHQAYDFLADYQARGATVRPCVRPGAGGWSGFWGWSWPSDRLAA